MKISVIIICYNEENNIKDCLMSLVSQSYGCDNFEIIVIDNDSADNTKNIVRGFCEKYGNIRLCINPVRGIAISRNIGVDNSNFDYVAFTDADCIAPREWLATLANGFKKYKSSECNLVAVGGSNIPPKINLDHYDALGLMLNSYLGSRGSVQGRVFKNDREVEHIPCVNVLYEKKYVNLVGGFDPSLGNIGEDQDITFKLKKLGKKFYYIKNCFVWHKLRDNLKDWAINMFIYGRGRIILIRKYPEMFNITFTMPMILVVAILFLPLSFLNKVFLLVPLAYFVLIFIVSIIISAKNRKSKLFIKLFVLFITTHIFYGIGEIRGLFIKNNNALKRKYTGYKSL